MERDLEEAACPRSNARGKAKVDVKLQRRRVFPDRATAVSHILAPLQSQGTANPAQILCHKAEVLGRGDLSSFWVNQDRAPS